MEADVESIKSEVERLSQRLAVIETGRDTGADGEGVAPGDNGGANEAQVIPQQKLRAFDVTCDGRENDPWLIYLPDGCISYAGFEPDEIDPAPDATTRLADLGTAIKNGGIYAHLYLELDDDSDSDSSTDPEIVGFQKLEIDTTPALTPTEDNIKIVNIKIATITDGAISQNVSSSLILGGATGNKGDAAPLPWDLKVKDGDLYVFSPIAYVLTASGQTKSQQELIVSGATKGEWFKITGLSSPVCCIIYASVSGSGSVTYSVDTAGRPSGSVVLFKQIIGTYARSGSSGPINSVTQFRRGAPTINGLGIADAASIFLNDNGETEIKGFKSQAAETTKLSQHLQAQTEFAGQVLVRTEVNGVKQLVFVPIGNCTGYTGTIRVATGEQRCNQESGYYIQSEYITCNVENGLIKSVVLDAQGQPKKEWTTGLATTPLSGT